MPRGGKRPGAGRPRKALSLHRIEGTFRPARHGRTAVVVPMPAAVAAGDWQPGDLEVAALSPRAQIWLQAVLQLYRLNAVEGQALLETLRVLSRVEALELEDGMGATAALARERRLFLSMWQSLGLEK